MENNSLTVSSPDEILPPSRTTTLGNIGINVKASELCHKYKPVEASPCILRYAPFNGVLAICTKMEKVHIVDIKNCKEPVELKTPDGSLKYKNMALSPDGRVLALCDTENKISVLNSAGGKPIFTAAADDNINTMAVSNDKKVAYAADNKLIMAFNDKTGVKTKQIKTNKTAWNFFDLEFDFCGEYLAVKYESGELEVLNCKNFKEAAAMHFNDVYRGEQADLSFSLSGNIISARRNYIDIMNVLSGEYLPRHIISDRVTSCALSDDGLYCAVGTDTGEIRVINLSYSFDNNPVKIKISGSAVTEIFFNDINQKIAAYCPGEGKFYFCDIRPARVAATFNILESGFLWTAPPDAASSRSGWFWTDRPDLIDISYSGESEKIVQEKDAKDYFNNFNRRDIIFNKLKGKAGLAAAMLQIDRLNAALTGGNNGTEKLLEKL